MVSVQVFYCQWCSCVLLSVVVMCFTVSSAHVFQSAQIICFNTQVSLNHLPKYLHKLHPWVKLHKLHPWVKFMYWGKCRLLGQCIGALLR